MLAGDVVRRLVPVAMVATLWLACAPSGLGETCRFSGDVGSPCGICIATNCQSLVNGCCGDDACAESLGDLDDCATGGSCKALASSVPPLAECITTSCAMCKQGGSDAGARDSGATDAPPRYTSSCSSPSGNYGCICSPAGGSDNECSSASVGGGVCCADRGWPEDGTHCSCDPFTCEPVVGSRFGVEMRCSQEDLHTDITEATGAKCCMDVFLKECKCGSSDMPCDPEDEVPRCSASAMGCISSRSRIESCSF